MKTSFAFLLTGLLLAVLLPILLQDKWSGAGFQLPQVLGGKSYDFNIVFALRTVGIIFVVTSVIVFLLSRKNIN
jgi:formate hydrogenlyase subunit 3/multisubunit Na+/H+ antiporter MnhD subunit